MSAEEIAEEIGEEIEGDLAMYRMPVFWHHGWRENFFDVVADCDADVATALKSWAKTFRKHAARFERLALAMKGQRIALSEYTEAVAFEPGTKKAETCLQMLVDEGLLEGTDSKGNEREIDVSEF
jgi:hypothetical protein